MGTAPAPPPRILQASDDPKALYLPLEKANRTAAGRFEVHGLLSHALFVAQHRARIMAQSGECDDPPLHVYMVRARQLLAHAEIRSDVEQLALVGRTSGVFLLIPELDELPADLISRTARISLSIASKVINNPAMYGAEVGVFCDRCGADECHDIWVFNGSTQEERFELARGSLRAEGWRCDDDGDLCAACVKKAG